MTDSLFIKNVLLSFQASFQEHRKDLSAVIMTDKKYLWFGSDETTTIERLSFIKPKKIAEHQQFRVAEFITLPRPEDEEIDIEGLACDGYYLWFTGSHSYKRKKVKSENSDSKNISRLAKIESEQNRYILGRIPLIDGQLLQSCPHPNKPEIQLNAAKLELTKDTNVLMAALADDPHLGAFIQAQIPGKDNGFDIEGLAVNQGRIFLGLRGPVLRGWAIILELEVEDSLPGILKLRKMGEEKQKYKKHFVWLNGLGIRDLCWDGEDLLILAGPTMDLDGTVQVYRLKNGVNLQENVMNNPEFVQEIPHGDRNDKAEGMTLFSEITNEPSLLVVYDSPADNRLVDESGVSADVFRLG
ncbi:hypothetical protein CLI64_03605 [Nostoc sp. CENA543]|uniref:DUF3616 domain-containing protein n=1 Tax=Nostoc sp. CENA543 TaxID=1869241 RepID=UPI000CA097CC|nr:DUF3616 domain-containing protein [Nostoc sp. CENA543]AUT04202.1 hypothetical protein CLI64_03605 [Nostoc sp. CENA543]